jgi:hypothetical protein
MLFRVILAQVVRSPEGQVLVHGRLAAQSPAVRAVTPEVASVRQHRAEVFGGQESIAVDLMRPYEGVGEVTSVCIKVLSGLSSGVGAAGPHLKPLMLAHRPQRHRIRLEGGKGEGGKGGSCLLPIPIPIPNPNPNPCLAIGDPHVPVFHGVHRLLRAAAARPPGPPPSAPATSFEIRGLPSPWRQRVPPVPLPPHRDGYRGGGGVRHSRHPRRGPPPPPPLPGAALSVARVARVPLWAAAGMWQPHAP